MNTIPRRLGSAITAFAIGAAGVLSFPATASADENRDGQWYLDALKVAEAHQVTKGEGITIGILDSGVDATHPDLAGNVLPGTDLAGTGGDGLTPSDDHGTSVASILVGGDDTDGILGIAPAAKLISVRITDADGEFEVGRIQEGIRWLADNGADVISLSLFDPGAEEGGQAAVDYAIGKNIVVVAGAGNRRGDEPNETWSAVGYPAAYRGVVAVTGTTREGEYWDGSVEHAYGIGNWAISAPATDMRVALRGGGYETADGTSFAAPIVAGTMALIKAKYPNLNQRQLLERLLLTADDKGTEGEDLEYGWGIVDPLAALTADVDYYEDPAPTDDTASEAVAATGDDGAGTGDLVPVIVSGTVLAVVVVGVLLLIRSRRRPPTPAAAPRNRPVGPPPQAAPESWRRPPEPGPPPPAR
ncbi:S8 family serine peptidase [Phytomonospora endophytica]|uniref:Type VII secretion-associated serine protease mycosin n=1 Tax=Phytomonospora endophytica TaxID=714109 RepID=A0A841FLK3_9ACTN|nr:S8 family serine peptidase [Phytomonospora endophytica]MBB6032830.1 type VII secretion-associated serine protease mycosin [Phytomonospora endophytica]GIG65056.1 type VII secretion-associated serine protease [Phytomonospora endophytica]